MASVLKISGGTAKAVYDDKWRPILEALGVMQVARASEVEFEPESGDWVATQAGTGKEIGRGKNRADVIRQEVDYLEANEL